MAENLNILISKLSDGKFHSGMALGEELNLSRASVWKYIQKISDLGIEVHSVRGKGYRLSQPLSLLEKDAIFSALAEEHVSRIQSLEILQEVDSTNSYAMRLLQNSELKTEYGKYSVILAEQQTQGKGRRGREWVSPYGRNIYLTLVRSLDAGTMGTEGISLVIGLSVNRALMDLSIQGMGVKWPNDVLCGGKKLAGILLEITGDITGLCQIVIGVGVNIHCDPGLMNKVNQPWTDLSRLTGGEVDRHALVAGIINNIVKDLDAFENAGFEPFLEEWHARDAMKDKEVELVTASGSHFGRAKGVAANGALIIEAGEGVQYFNGGEVSLRGMPDR